MKQVGVLLAAALLAALVVACGDGDDAAAPTTAATQTEAPIDVTEPAPSGLPQGDEPFPLDPADFVAEIDNPYWPMTPGNRWVFTEIDEEGNELRVEVTVTDEKRDIIGISAAVVHDVVTMNGEVIEDTFDWYAQDVDGNVWYMGEATAEYEDGVVVSTAGSWEAGVDGALAGVVVPGNPEVGMMYRQEYYAGEAEDVGEVLSLDEAVEVPFGSFEGCLQTEDTTPLEPDVLEHKYYCQSVGPVLAVDVGGGGGREELTSFEEGTSARSGWLEFGLLHIRFTVPS